MADTPHPSRGPPSAVAVCLAAFLCLTLVLSVAPVAGAGRDEAPRGARKVERYPPSFRLNVKKAIERGVERMGMLTDRRWIGTHDWYKEGADLFLARQGIAGGWGDHVQTSFAVLFLKRATRAADRVVTTD